MRKTAYDMLISECSSDVCSSDLKYKRREMGTRKAGDHRQGGNGLAQREDRLDALAGGHHASGGPEADAMAEQVAHGSSGIGDGRLVLCFGIEPSAMDPGDRPAQVGEIGRAHV